MRIGLIAGEASGDVLGAQLMAAVRTQDPAVEFAGITGANMRRAGCDSLATIDQLAVMGLAEVVRHLPRLLRLRRKMVRQLIAAQLDLVIGIDAPDFNLGLLRRLRQRGLTTAQYVSPTVWAWRPGRVRTIAAACDEVLTLYPFEAPLLEDHDIAASFVGHPLAHKYPLQPDQHAARAQLGLSASDQVLALLPGSRSSELDRHLDLFAQTAARLLAREPSLRLVLPTVDQASADAISQRLSTGDMLDSLQIVVNDTATCLTAANAALIASGTATLESVFCHCPMVVCYRVAGLTHFLLRRLGWLRTRQVALPNILSQTALVPEFLQADAQPEPMAQALEKLLREDQTSLRSEFAALHAKLQKDPAVLATRVLHLASKTEASASEVRQT